MSEAFPDPRTLLKRYGLSAKKSWGQNFLISSRVYRAIVDAANFGLRFRSLVEIAFIVLVFMGGATLAAREYPYLVARAQVSESLALFAGLKVDLTAFYSQHGHWPVTDAEIDSLPHRGEDISGAYVRGIEIAEHGVLLVWFRDNRRVSPLIADRNMVFRPMTNVFDSSAPITWSCGNWQPPAGMTMSLHNPTTVDTHSLPFTCREYFTYE